MQCMLWIFWHCFGSGCRRFNWLIQHRIWNKDLEPIRRQNCPKKTLSRKKIIMLCFWFLEFIRFLDHVEWILVDPSVLKLTRGGRVFLSSICLSPDPDPDPGSEKNLNVDPRNWFLNKNASFFPFGFFFLFLYIDTKLFHKWILPLRFRYINIAVNLVNISLKPAHTHC
jgi:hypothetical protein